jgi:hypothetical protein
MSGVLRKRGFTLVETIVATIILCGSVLTIGAICSRAVTGTRINRSYETALNLVNRQLSLIDYVGIDEFLEMGQMSGDFEDIAPGYRWQVNTEYQELDALYYVSITVYWYEHTRRNQLTVDTMLDGVSEYVTSAEESTETDTGMTG